MLRVSGWVRSTAVAVLAACGFILASAGVPAQAANVLQKQIYMTGPNYDGHLPACDAALGKIASRFAHKEGRFWNSNLEILGFEKVRQTAFRPWAKHTIPRRFCSAVALVSDGRKRRVDYWIGEDTDMIGVGWGVEWCVAGLDRNWAYNPACKMARP
ncbi:MAG: hypothetical protein Q8M24_17495 [Pseudolabrys sp.]|nr:hypothetical protein [Pseudolabrys sp.]MDP2297242.1 hypothetical protein [Pseudolabrys sp.]